VVLSTKSVTHGQCDTSPVAYLPNFRASSLISWYQ